MNFANNRTFELWRSFMPRHHEVNNRIGNDLFSLEVYDDADHFKNFDPNRYFTKWAAVEVSDLNTVPEKMNSLLIPSGLYVVFLFKGDHTKAVPAYTYIFQEWLPKSEYKLDHRPHFAVMGEKYKNNDPNSEEEIYIPVIKK